MTEVVESKAGTSDARDMKSRASQARLMNLHDAARYIGVSYWTMRDYVADGLIPRVMLPCSRRRRKGGVIERRAGDIETRRIYVDRSDLDALIEKCKREAECHYIN